MHEEEVKDLCRKKNAMLQDIEKDVFAYIKQETDVSDNRAKKIWAYLFEKYHSNGLYDCIAQMDDLLDVFK